MLTAATVAVSAVSPYGSSTPVPLFHLQLLPAHPPSAGSPAPVHSQQRSSIDKATVTQLAISSPNCLSALSAQGTHPPAPPAAPAAFFAKKTYGKYKIV